MSFFRGFICISVFWSVSAFAAFKQVSYATPQSNSSAVSVVMGSSQSAGDLNVVIVGWNDTSATVSSVTDSLGNIYSLATGPTSGTGIRQSIYYAKNIKGGSNTVKVSFSVAARYPDVRVLEYSGMDTVSPFDKAAGGSGNSTTASTASVTTTTANEVLVGAGTTATHFTGPGSGYTQRIITSPDSDIAEDRTVTSTGTYRATAALSTGYWVFQIATFKVAGATTTTSPSPSSSPVASPSPTSTTSCTPGFGSYSGSSQPPACWAPYSSTSAFKRRVASAPTLASNSSTVVTNLVSSISPSYFGLTHHITGASTSDYAHPIFWSKSTDPLYTISSCTYSDGQTVGKTVRIPQNARPAQGGDAHMTVIDQSTGLEWDFYNFPKSGPPAGGGSISPRGCSHSSATSGSGLATGTTAAGYTNLAGMVRPEELLAGQINHALFAVVDCVQGYVYPARQGAFACPSGTSGPPNGAHFWLDYTDSQIAAMGLPKWEFAMVTALAHYGAYVGDTAGIGGTDGIKFMFLSSETYVALGLSDPMVTVAKNSGIGMTALSTGGYIMSFQFNSSKIDWAHHLHVLAPCVAQGTCQ